jgi:arylsulfatase A-like enzyme
MIVIITATVLAVRVGGTPDRAIDNRPNILIIVTDDQRAVGTLAVMQQTRRWLERGGVRYPQAFVTTPFCCPSRVSISTGQYVHNHHVTQFWSDTADFDDVSIERYLDDAGYQTAIFGKYLVRWPIDRDPRHFDEWAISQVPHGVSYFDEIVNANGEIGQRYEYQTSFVRDQAISFLNRAADEPDPWFMYLGFKAPHSPYTPEARYRERRVGPLKADPAMQEKGLGDKPMFVRRWGGNGSSSPRQYGGLVRERQLRTLMSVDDALGSVFRELVRLGEDETTLVVFTSDNGYTWGEHGIAAEKLVPYTPSVAVPLLLRWPGHVQPGTVDRRLAANIDIAPTVLTAAGLAPAADAPMDGRSLLDPYRRDRLLLEFWAKAPVPSWASTRTASYQYIEYYDRDGRVVFREYYDLRADPWQLRNLLHDGVPANDPDVRPLSEMLAAERRCAGASCP